MRNAMKRRTQTIAILISVCLHSLITFIVVVGPRIGLFEEKKADQPIEVVLLESPVQSEPQFRQGQIVSQDQRINDEVPKDTKYLSQFNQTVEKQTRAELQDRFRNTAAPGGQKAQKQKPGEADQHQELTRSDEQKPQQRNPLLSESDGIDSGPLAAFKPDFRLRPPPMGTTASGGGDGPSATDDHLKEVEVGMQTLLSTREFVYYSYYNRIKDRLRQYWEPKIKEKFERIVRQGRTIASDSDRITKCIILLDRNGTLVRVQIVGASGIVDLDEAAVEAFKAAAPFPNPPKGIVEADGYIRIRWDFILEASRSNPFHPSAYARNDD